MGYSTVLLDEAIEKKKKNGKNCACGCWIS
jgi:hypothetical protein